MRKLLLVLLVVTLAAFLFIGCLPATPTEGEGEGEGEIECESILLINYPMDPEDTGGDKLHRGFYIKAFPGTSLSKVDLWIGANEAGDYTFELTAREGTYNGPIIEESQANIYLTENSEDMLVTTFNFSSRPVQMNSIVTFVINKISGSGTCYFATEGEYGDIPQEDILLIETDGTAPPLDTFKRYGIAIRVYGCAY